MTKTDAIKHFGTQVLLAKALNTSQSTVASWGISPPDLRQLQIEALTGGALKADANILPKSQIYRANDSQTLRNINEKKLLSKSA